MPERPKANLGASWHKFDAYARAGELVAVDLEPDVRRALVHAPALGQRLDEMQAPATRLGLGPVPGGGDEPDALVDDLDMHVRGALGAHDQLHGALAAVLDAVGDQLGDQQPDVGHDLGVEPRAEALDRAPRAGGRRQVTVDVEGGGFRHQRRAGPSGGHSTWFLIGASSNVLRPRRMVCKRAALRGANTSQSLLK